VALPAANMGIKTGPPGLFTKYRNFDPLLKECTHWTGNLTAQAHARACVRPFDSGDWALIA
jgi:hypothetical protein